MQPATLYTRDEKFINGYEMRTAQKVLRNEITNIYGYKPSETEISIKADDEGKFSREYNIFQSVDGDKFLIDTSSEDNESYFSILDDEFNHLFYAKILV